MTADIKTEAAEIIKRATQAHSNLIAYSPENWQEEQRFDLLRSQVKAAIDLASKVATERDHLKAEVENLRHGRNELLCVIHRDGGHYIAQHGEEKALVDAHTVALTALHEAEQFKARCEELEEALKALSWAASDWSKRADDDGLCIVRADYVGIPPEFTVGDLRRARALTGGGNV